MSQPGSDPLVELAIRHGHRELLDTFRELAFGDSDRLSPTTAAHEARAALAYLRQAVLPFAAWEERTRGPRDPSAEDTAFEHAFLAAEIDALAGSIDGRCGGGQQSDTCHARLVEVTDLVSGERIRRHLQRIEAILELHVQKVEDREVVTAAPQAVEIGTAPPRERSSGQHEMDDPQIAGFLASRDWGVLATIDSAGPYAVPVSYGFRGGTLFFATGPGRKLQNLVENATLCLTVVEVHDTTRWRSVVVTGRAVPVSGVRERAIAVAALRQRRAGGARLTPGDLARLARARLLRIEVNEITGRTCG